MRWRLISKSIYGNFDGAYHWNSYTKTRTGNIYAFFISLSLIFYLWRDNLFDCSRRQLPILRCCGRISTSSTTSAAAAVVSSWRWHCWNKQLLVFYWRFASRSCVLKFLEWIAQCSLWIAHCSCVCCRCAWVCSTICMQFISTWMAFVSHIARNKYWKFVRIDRNCLRRKHRSSCHCTIDARRRNQIWIEQRSLKPPESCWIINS